MSGRPQRLRRTVVHLFRVLLFVVVIVLVRVQHAKIMAIRQSEPEVPLTLEQVLPFFPTADALAATSTKAGQDVLDSSKNRLGYVLQTSPDSDHIIGFSGPTNTLIAFSNEDRIVGIEILSSRDTEEHVDQVEDDRSFRESFNGRTWNETAKLANVDAVAGATLTSLAIQESIIYRLSGGRPSLRFPNPLVVEQARPLFEAVHSLTQDAVHSSLWNVRNEQGEQIGSILRTSPHADNVVGYQGPTETLIGFDSGGRVVGISLGSSYDNEEYVTYVREDTYFLSLFNALNLKELAGLDPMEAQIEGVSGATLTSMAVTDGILIAAEQHRQAINNSIPIDRPILRWTIRDFGTAAMVLSGLIIGLTSLRGKKGLRVGFQVFLIVYLGLINGDMISQAMLFGWAQHGIPWSSAGGLLLLTIAALLTPIATRRNVYCTHLCPHGAVQNLLKDRLPWRVRLPNWFERTLRLIPALILLWCMIVAMTLLPFSLVDIEPFDAWVFRVGGWATISIAVVGLVASLFVPMAYCRYGCPTGAMLNFLRFNARSGRWQSRDWFALALVATACCLYFF